MHARPPTLPTLQVEHARPQALSAAIHANHIFLLCPHGHRCKYCCSFATCP